jgi:hypothetical protein
LVLFSATQIARFLAGGVGPREAEEALKALKAELALPVSMGGERILRSIAAIQVGAPAEVVAMSLNWKEFEMFCAGLLRLSGYTVTENITLTRPRIQIDLLARSSTLALVVDCKHWRGGIGAAALTKAAAAQTERAKLVRSRMNQLEPLAVVILVFSNEIVRFVDGVAIVPIYAFSSFLENPAAYSDMMELF